KDPAAVFHHQDPGNRPGPGHRRAPRERSGRQPGDGKSGRRRARGEIPGVAAALGGDPMKTILIVDDQPSARYGFRRALEARYRIVEADSAEAAREVLAAERPDLVLLDVVLPGMDGLSFLKWMRDEGHGVPVLMVSALDAAKTAVEALRLGAADYLVK